MNLLGNIDILTVSTSPVGAVIIIAVSIGLVALFGLVTKTGNHQSSKNDIQNGSQNKKKSIIKKIWQVIQPHLP